ncbi:hypothetical protein GCM10023219_12740 [Stakelama sediminis]|uniref:Uncharacterized protein n=1 Tax=Stakelama sediminis TaxID=463200 RepID=A0A840YWS0_9SPHN|nr:hypothetical protein [Stakelama sediminis]
MLYTEPVSRSLDSHIRGIFERVSVSERLGTHMTNQQDSQYWEKREQQERDSAHRANDEGARRAHAELADRYNALRNSPDTIGSTLPTRG